MNNFINFKINRVFRNIISLCIFVIFFSCSNSLVDPAPTLVEEQTITKQAPIDLYLNQAYIQNDTLYIKSLVKVKHDLLANSVKVSSLGLKEGEVVRKSEKLLSNVVKDLKLKAGARIIVPFEMPIADLTELQLSCSWGDREVSSQKIHRVVMNNKEKHNKKYSEANSFDEKSDIFIDELKININKSKTEEKQAISGNIRNLSSKTIKDVSIAFGLFWLQDSGKNILPQNFEPKKMNEEVLVFDQVELPQGGSLPFRISFENPSINVKGGKFIPHVRLLSYQDVK